MNSRLNAFLLLTIVAFSASAEEQEGVREDELFVSTDLAVRESGEASCDLRMVMPVSELDDASALKNFTYSAIGWDLNPVADATRSVAIMARAGALEDGVFSPDGSAEVMVLAETTGQGTINWHPSAVAPKVYQLVHTVRKNGVIDGSETLYGYFDFTHCDSVFASQAVVDEAVLAEITHSINVGQDRVSPWQPIDQTVTLSGIETDATLASGEKTTTTFTFSGCGVLQSEYRLTGGTLAVIVDGEPALTFDEPAFDWTRCSVALMGYGEHVASFVYTAATGDVVAIRNVRWEERSESARAVDEGDESCVDLQDGVRASKCLADILPFEYSSTNWIGDVAQVSAESVARVTIERLTGTDPDVRNWAEPVPGTFRELVKESGEAAVKWRPRKGVWKATFDILNGDFSVHHETAIFDLRNVRATGFALIVK